MEHGTESEAQEQSRCYKRPRRQNNACILLVFRAGAHIHGLHLDALADEALEQAGHERGVFRRSSGFACGEQKKKTSSRGESSSSLFSLQGQSVVKGDGKAETKRGTSRPSDTNHSCAQALFASVPEQKLAPAHRRFIAAPHDMRQRISCWLERSQLTKCEQQDFLVLPRRFCLVVVVQNVARHGHCLQTCESTRIAHTSQAQIDMCCGASGKHLKANRESPHPPRSEDDHVRDQRQTTAHARGEVHASKTSVKSMQQSFLG